MANSPIIADDYAGSGGSTIVQGEGYHVAQGFGVLYGGPAGAVPRDINLQGGLEGWSLNGKTQGPILSTKPCETILATGIIKASDTGATLIAVVRGMDRAEFTRVSFRDFVDTNGGAASPANMAGRLYRAPPVSGAWSEQAAIIPETNLGGLAGYKTKRVDALQEISEATALWYRPLVGGPSTLTFEVSVWGMPRWRINQPIPVPAP